MSDIQVVCMADLHGHYKDLEVPNGDLLIIAGDITTFGSLKEIEEFGNWLKIQPHDLKIVIAGNHDLAFQSRKEKASLAINKHQNCIYLEDDSYQFKGLHIYGSPWQPVFYNWAFNLPVGEPLRKVWEKIPHNTDILITHTPPRDCLDFSKGNRIGCQDLKDRLLNISLKLHVFGHIHENYGMVETHAINNKISINAALCDDANKLIHSPIQINIKVK